MFDSLKKKIFSFFSKKEEKPSKEKKKASKEKPRQRAQKIKPARAIKQKVPSPKAAKEEVYQQKIEPVTPDQQSPTLSSASSAQIPKKSVAKQDVTAESAEQLPLPKKHHVEPQSPQIQIIPRVEKDDSMQQPVEETKPGFFFRLLQKITTSKLSQQEFDEAFEDLQITLLENNVALEAVDAIKQSLSNSLIGQQMKKGEAERKILQSLKEAILGLLLQPPDLIEKIMQKEGVFVIVFFGINGTGKTTTIAKIAYLLKQKNIPIVLAAADTFRAASIEQIKIHGEKIGVPVIAHDYGADPASVAFDAKKYALAHNAKVVLIDTAGRMYTKENLLKEMEKIIRVAQPDLKIFVGESITGNDVIDQTRSFNEAIGIDGIILSKADIDDKGGAILSVSHVTQKPIYFLGTGQGYTDLQAFNKNDVLKNLGLE